MKSISQIIEDQVHRWQLQQKEKPAAKTAAPVVTISREPGSGGRIVAQRLAETLGFEVFHQELLHEMAKRAEVSRAAMAERLVVEGLENPDVTEVREEARTARREAMGIRTRLLAALGREVEAITKSLK